MKIIGLLVTLAVLVIGVSLWPSNLSSPTDRRVNDGHLLSPEFVGRIYQTTGEFDRPGGKIIWFNQLVAVPDNYLSWVAVKPEEPVLGQSTGQKRIEIDLTVQRLRAYQGNNLVYDFPVSSGLPWMPTVTGEFTVWAKVKAQRMTGGRIEDGTFYDLPNVPFVQYFYQGYGLHGAYWHNDFGKPRSHGCVNLRPDDARALFFWSDPVIDGEKMKVLYNIRPEVSTKVIVKGITPTKLD